jgi:hypothetical protein
MMGDFNGIVFLEELRGQLDEVALAASSEAAAPGRAARLPWTGRRRGAGLRGRVSLLRRRAIIVALAVLAALAAVALSQESVRSQIRELFGLAKAPGTVVLQSVAADSAGGLWVVGESSDGQHAVVAYRDGEEWVRLPRPGIAQPRLLAPVSRDDVWVMTSQDFGVGSIEHWDGTSWRAVPYPSARDDEFWDALALGPDDVWLVGSRVGRPFREVGDEPGQMTLGRRPCAWHWDGSTWSATKLPRLTGRSGGLGVVSGRGGEVWAAGGMERLVGTATPAWFADGKLPMPVTRDDFVLLRWNGTAWRRVSVPDDSKGGSGGDVCVLGPGQVYVALTSQLTADDTKEQRYASTVLRRTGDGWRQVGGSRAGLLDGWIVSSMAATSTGGVWLMGDLHGDLATLQWDGEAWRKIQPRIPKDFGGAVVDTSLWQLATADTGEVWLFGGATSITDGSQQAWRWDGERWEWIATKL